MAQHRWQSWWQSTWRKAWGGMAPSWWPTRAGAAAAPSTVSSRLLALSTMLIGLLLAWLLGWSLGWGGWSMSSSASSLGDNSPTGVGEASSGRKVPPTLVLRGAWVAPGNGSLYPAGQPGEVLPLPDDWSRSHPQYQGSIWYRLRFDTPAHANAETLLAAQITRACSRIEVQLNGQLLYRAGRMEQPVSRQCYQPHVVALPHFLLRSGENQLDIKVSGHALDQVSARQRAGSLGEVRIGPWAELRVRHDDQVFWSVTVAQIIGGILVVLGLFALGMAWVRRLSYLAYFGLLTLSWALLTGRLWLTGLPLSNDKVEVLLASLFAPMTLFGVKFLLGYAGHGLHRQHEPRQARHINTVLWLQMLLMPASLLAWPSQVFTLSLIWYSVLAAQVIAAMVYFLWFAGRSRRAEFWLMGGTLGVVAGLICIELCYQFGLISAWSWSVTYFVMPMLFTAVSFRLIQVYARALQTAEGARAQLERRVQEISGEIERNFTQIAELRVEQIAEKERKRIAADLHDDLGAKLLTIVHTSDNDRISSLAREALEEMRLSVRGLTGRPMRLPDALADWRAEVVSRLGQAGIEVEWRHPLDVMDEPLSARTYVQTTRIIREAVSNIIKHSQASHVVITAEVGEHDFQIAIQDNGRGIPLELDGRLDRGHGMASMKNRAKQLSGQCLVESGPGFGTVIRMTLPLEIESVASALTGGATGAPSHAGTASILKTPRGDSAAHF